MKFKILEGAVYFDITMANDQSIKEEILHFIEAQIWWS